MDKIIEFIKILFGKPYRKPVNLEPPSSKEKPWIITGDDDDDDDGWVEGVWVTTEAGKHKRLDGW